MRIDNMHHAVAKENLMLNDTVVIEDKVCRKITKDDIGRNDLFSVINKSVSAGEDAMLSGKDTIFHVEINA